MGGGEAGDGGGDVTPTGHRRNFADETILGRATTRFRGRIVSRRVCRCRRRRRRRLRVVIFN